MNLHRWKAKGKRIGGRRGEDSTHNQPPYLNSRSRKERLQLMFSNDALERNIWKGTAEKAKA
jgi:hypothetical protein